MSPYNPTSAKPESAQARCDAKTGAYFFIASVLLGAVLVPPAAKSQILRDNLWITDGPVYAVAPTDSVIYLGGDFTRVGPATGSAVAIDAGTGAAIRPYPSVVE